jgi:hypothetical protein
MGEEDIMYCGASLRSTNIEKTQSARESVITEFRWFAGQRLAAWIT